MKGNLLSVVVFVGLVLSAACSTEQVKHTDRGTMQLPSAQSYLDATALPSSLLLVPPPPAEGSAALARDEEVSRGALAMQGSPRWKLAASDAVLAFPEIGQTFSCALRLPIGEAQTPKTLALLRRTMMSAARSTSEAKDHYRRSRPFMNNGKPTCTPEAETVLRGNGSYPSGHSAIGWVFGLVLSEVSPAQTTALVARGRAFGQSRVMCNVHWQSDVDEGRLVGTAVFARLHAEQQFRSDVEAARAEIEALRAGGAKVDRDCAAEAKVLDSWQ